jgi:hypothetical protein
MSKKIKEPKKSSQATKSNTISKRRKEPINSSQAMYDYSTTYPDIDYSEVVTEPGLVLSMQEIYNRYAAQGVDLLSAELVPDDDRDSDMMDFAPDDNLDVLQQSYLLRQRSADRKHSASKQKKGEHREPEEPKPAPEKKDEEQSDKE